MVRLKAQKNHGIYIFFSEQCDDETRERKARTMQEVFELITNEPEQPGIQREEISRVCIERRLTCKLSSKSFKF